MKRMIFPLLGLILLISCGSNAKKVEKVMEDGVEVVLNRILPYVIKGEPSTFTLQREFTIDTENDKMAELGLTDIGIHFDIDSEGNIYLAGYENTEGMIFKFDRDGNFIQSFLHKGQGPGELQGRNYVSLFLTVDKNDNIAVSDFGNKLVVFDTEGKMIEERKIDSRIICAAPLANGNFLSFKSGYKELVVSKVVWE